MTLLVDKGGDQGGVATALICLAFLMLAMFMMEV